MKNYQSTFINGIKYKMKEVNGEIVQLKRFNSAYNMWVEIRFSECGEKAEKDLLELLTSEYVSRTSDAISC